MSLAALFLILASSLAWTGFDFTRKLLVRNIRPLPLTVLVMLGQVPFFFGWAFLADELHVSSGYLVPALATFALNIVGNVLFLWSVQVSPFSAVMPMLSFSPVFATLFGFLFLGEKPTVAQGAGIVIVFSGAVLFHFNRSLLKVEKGVWGMLGVALLFSVAVTCDKAALSYAAPSMHALLLCLVVSAGALLITAARGQVDDLKQVRSAVGLFILASAFASVALALQFLALRFALVGLFEVIKRSSGMGVSLLLGYFALKEQISLQKVGGVIMMAVGVALVLSG